MTPKQEKKIAKITENINAFIEKMDEAHAKSIKKGKDALKTNDQGLINFWVIQYKLTNEYKHQAVVMLEQLEIARYSSEMQQTAKGFFADMNKMASALSKVFSFTGLNSLTKDLEKQSIKMQMNRERTNDMIEETNDRFKEVQESFETGTADTGMEISDSEKANILKEFQTVDKPKNDMSSILKGFY